MSWDSTDLRALRRLGAGLGSFQVIEVKENSVNDTDQAKVDDGFGADYDGSFEPDGQAVFGGPKYPEYPYSLADHVYTWSPKLPDGSMMVIRANTAEALAEAAEALTAVSGRLRAAWGQVAGGGAPAPQAPAQGFPQPPQGVNYNPQMPPPNQPFPGQPAWQQAGAPQMPQQQGWGGAPQGGGSGLPAGWYRLTVPFQQKATFDGIVTQFGLKKGDPFKGGQVSWRKEQKFWACAPEVAQAFAQFNPVAA